MLKLSKLNMVAQIHQDRVADNISRQGQSGVLAWHGLGSGKTFTAILAADKLNAPLIAIVPASLRNNFEKEIKNSGFANEYMVISYNAAIKLMDDDAFLAKASKSVVAYDEAHNMGRSDSIRSRLPKKINALKTIMLTGTPVRNRPSELVPIMIGLDIDGFPRNVKDFNDSFIEKRRVDVGHYNRIIRRMKDGIRLLIKNKAEFKRLVGGKVDHHDYKDPALFPSSEEELVKVEMDGKQLEMYKLMIGANSALRYKMENNIPPNKMEMGKMQSFLVGPRMLSNTISVASTHASHRDSAKIRRMVQDIASQKDGDKNFKGFVYSNYLDAGINDVSNALDEKGITYVKFSGKLNDKQKKMAIDQYNDGQVDILLASGAGAEGLDLKGTKLIQIMEPHWNNARVRQAIGRGIRYKSHINLPENERHVKVKRYISTVPKTLYERVLNKKNKQSADEYLFNMSEEKDMLNEAFLSIMRRSQ